MEEGCGGGRWRRLGEKWISLSLSDKNIKPRSNGFTTLRPSLRKWEYRLKLITSLVVMFWKIPRQWSLYNIFYILFWFSNIVRFVFFFTTFVSFSLQHFFFAPLHTTHPFPPPTHTKGFFFKNRKSAPMNAIPRGATHTDSKTGKLWCANHENHPPNVKLTALWFASEYRMTPVMYSGAASKYPSKKHTKNLWFVYPTHLLIQTPFVFFFFEKPQQTKDHNQ